jgi:putative colanic acid biosynthesis UDP-glucose lipid carrier transferase
MRKGQHQNRLFLGAPPTINSFVAAVMEPVVTVLCLLFVAKWHHEAIDRPELTLCMLLLALTFPGADRFKDDALDAALHIVSEWIAVLMILILCGYATDSLKFFSTSLLVWWALLTPVVQWVAFAIGKSWIRLLAMRPQFRQRAIVIGAGENGIRVANALAAHRESMHDMVGFFDDRAPDRLDEAAAGKILGRFSDVAAQVSARSIRNVYISLPLASQPRIAEMLAKLQDTTASVYYAPDVFGVAVIQGHLHDINGMPVVGLLETPFTGTNHLVKRSTDIVLASAILVLILPILIAVAIGVKMSSPGPVIFKQRRNGLDGEEILVYKFRSMRAQDNGPVVQQATRGDPRVTPFGAFIRKTSLDELPQLFNVLFGSMSLVGPRPHAVAHNEQFRKIVQAYMLRHKVRPGITGWAQVNGHRGETDTVDKMAARVHYDLEYLRNWSLSLDLRIIARTVRVMLFDRNAY